MDTEAFLRRWTRGEGGAERANYTLFLSELCDVLGVARPDPASGGARLGAYQFEAPVRSRESEGVRSTKRIDLYKRDAFILEAKQSQARDRADQVPLPGFDGEALGRRTTSKRWDTLMMRARSQAEGYVYRLPTDHKAPPFLIVCDVGNSFEVFADFSGTGRNYAQFPDRNGFRIYLEDLRDEAIRARLRAIWDDPLNPHQFLGIELNPRAAAIAELVVWIGYPALPERSGFDGRVSWSDGYRPSRSVF